MCVSYTAKATRGRNSSLTKLKINPVENVFSILIGNPYWKGWALGLCCLALVRRDGKNLISEKTWLISFSFFTEQVIHEFGEFDKHSYVNAFGKSYPYVHCIILVELLHLPTGEK